MLRTNAWVHVFLPALLQEQQNSLLLRALQVAKTTHNVTTTMAQHNVHFHWMGSNKHIATTPANNKALFGHSLATHLQLGLAPQLGLEQQQWYQVTVYFDQRRLTNDALIYRPDPINFPPFYASYIPQTAEAWQSFLKHAAAATADIVLLVTRCSSAYCNAAHVLASASAYNSDVQTMLSKYANNVAFMIRAVSKWPDQVFKQATESMQRNELFAATAVTATRRVAPLIDPQLWRKASFVLLAACNNNADFRTVLQYCGDNVKKDTKTMLRLIKDHAAYINIAAAKLDFEFLVEAVAANYKCLRYLKDFGTAKKVAQALPWHSVAQQCFQKLKREGYWAAS